jgi:hypothetical protein
MAWRVVQKIDGEVDDQNDHATEALALADVKAKFTTTHRLHSGKWSYVTASSMWVWLYDNYDVQLFEV